MTTTPYGYCPRCDRRSELVLIGSSAAMIHACHRCKATNVYDDKQQWEEDERRRYRELLDCDHEFNYPDHRAPTDQCCYCGLPKGTDPEDAIDDRIDISDIQEEYDDD